MSKNKYDYGVYFNNVEQQLDRDHGVLTMIYWTFELGDWICVITEACVETGEVITGLFRDPWDHEEVAPAVFDY